jgi:hypothetical protein
MTKTNPSKSIKMAYRVTARACENAGAVDYTVTEIITDLGDGTIRVESHAKGTQEGDRVDSKDVRVGPCTSFERAIEYRKSIGYHVVQ